MQTNGCGLTDEWPLGDGGREEREGWHTEKEGEILRILGMFTASLW